MIAEQKKLDEILKLTPEQKDKLNKNKEESKAKMKPIMQKMSKKKYQLEQVMLSDASKETKKKKELSYTDLSKLAVQRKKQIFLKQIEKANTLEEIEEIENKIKSLSGIVPKKGKLPGTIKELLIEKDN